MCRDERLQGTRAGPASAGRHRRSAAPERHHEPPRTAVRRSLAGYWVPTRAVRQPIMLREWRTTGRTSRTRGLDDIMNGVATFRGDEILADAADTILAVGTERGRGVAFDFAVYSDGEYAAEAKIAIRRNDGHWEELSDGGAWGDGWPTPWRPEPDGWDGRPLLVLGSAGAQVDDESELPNADVVDQPRPAEVYVYGVYGFAARTWARSGSSTTGSCTR